MPASVLDSASSDLMPLPIVAVEAGKKFGVIPPPGSYHRLRLATLDGRVASTRIGGRIFVARSALDAVAAELGITSPTNAAA
jgi:hypothetical protein